jgi:EamA domain-containing membrane protein RarD
MTKKTWLLVALGVVAGIALHWAYKSATRTPGETIDELLKEVP